MHICEGRRVSVRVLEGDCLSVLATLPNESVQCCVTSPPYWGLRDYGNAGQLGLEKTPELYVEKMVAVFREVRRVLRSDGVCWLNLGDSYSQSGKGGNPERSQWSGFVGSKERERAAQPRALRAAEIGLKPKDLIGIPWRVAFALQADGWYLRSDVIWAKPNPMPESVTDRPTKAHEYLFLLAKSASYYYDATAIAEPAECREDPRPFGNAGENRHGDEGRIYKPRKSVKRGEFNGKTNAMPGREAFRAITPTRNRRTVWTIATSPFPGAHFAVMPPKLVEPCILAGTSPQACEKCGAPWERMVERTAMAIERSGRTHELGRTRSSGTMIEPPTSTAVGWQPTCTCENTGSAKCVVLDPFGGAGTVGLVADRLGREAILIELNPEYAKLARERIHDDAPLFSGDAA